MLHAAALALGLSAAAVAAAPRVISINLCTDQLLLTLADPGQIVGLSPYARDDARSWASADARRFPNLSGSAEEILHLRPDLVLSGRFTKRATREILRAKGVRLVELDAVRSLGEAKAQIGQVGALIGQEDRARREIARIDEAIERTRRAGERTPMTILPLQRRGWVSGGATLMTSLLDVVGLRNAGASLSRGLGRQVTLEAIVALRPDLLLVSRAGDAPEDQGAALLEHEALRRLYPPDRRMVLPEKLTICGGPMLADALDQLAAAIDRRR
jgi:iron complex transport system substrate-binding protein